MIRIGMVGAGAIGPYHKRAILANEECELTAVCDIVEKNAQAIAEGTAARVYTDYKVMQESENLDAVILNLPHFLHKDISIYFLERKVAVLVEKPMALNVAECDAMIEAAEKNGTVFAIGHVQRYMPCYRKLKELYEAGALGKFCAMTEVRNCDYFTNRPHWFVEKAKSGGGIVMNYCAHTLDKMYYTLGAKVEKITAYGSNFLNDEDVEATAQVFLQLDNGGSTSFTFSGCKVPNQYEINFYFTNGAAKIEGGSILWLSQNGEPFHKVELDYNDEFITFQLEEFVKLMKGEPSEVVTPEYGREVIRVLEEIFRQIGSY